jgi:hypothetical protein
VFNPNTTQSSTGEILVKRLIGILASTLALAACSDAAVPTGIVAKGIETEQEFEGRGVFQRYVAMGTSVSMGWQSDGVDARGQRASWPAQLALLAHRELSQP